MLKDKLKLLLLKSGISQRQLAKHYGISEQQQSNKIVGGKYKLRELVELAEITGTELAFIKGDEIIVSFDKSDL